MKVFNVLPLIALSTAFVLPDQEVMRSEAVQNIESPFEKLTEQFPSANEVLDNVETSAVDAFDCVRHRFSDAVDYTIAEVGKFGKSFEEAFDYQSWLEHTEDALQSVARPPKRPKHPKRPPHHPPHHQKPNQTVYEIIASSKYTTILTKLINEYPDLVDALNGTAANYTIFAPADVAFKKIPEHVPKPSKEDLKKILSFHISSDFYPVGRMLVSRTIPTLYKSPALGDEPQRINTQLSLRGVTLQFHAKILAADVFGTNGVIHGIDSILVPPPKVIDILKLAVSEFSTLDLALAKTGIGAHMEDTSSHIGGTLFAPTNSAFKRLGFKANAFLFSKYGEKYLKGLILYHMVPNFTLYSDAFYKGEEASEHDDHRIPKGRYHVDLPTALEGKSLAIDIGRYGRLIEIKINGYNRVAIPDGIAKDGVIHVVNTVLIPPRKPGMYTESEEDLTVEELKERLEPYVDSSEDWSQEL